MSEFKVAVIVGSLRKESHNLKLAKALGKLGKGRYQAAIVSIGDLPLFNEDLEKDVPAPVARLKKDIESADAVLFVTPEYNRSMPGVLKNAIDWASRPPSQPFDRKPTAIMGASPGTFGTARGQHHLRQILVSVNALVVTRPEVMIGQAASRFDAEGNVTDEGTRKLIAELLAALRDWTLRLRG